MKLKSEHFIPENFYWKQFKLDHFYISQKNTDKRSIRYLQEKNQNSKTKPFKILTVRNNKVFDLLNQYEIYLKMVLRFINPV